MSLFVRAPLFPPARFPLFSCENDGEDDEEEEEGGDDDDAYGAVAVIRVMMLCEVRRRETHAIQPHALTHART